MEDESARLVRLVSEVLETSMIEAGTFSYSFEDVDRSAPSGAPPRARPTRVRVEHGLPAVHGDPARLRQVLGNLLDNAVKYSPEGEPVDVRADVDGDRVLVDVTDRGDGIEPGDQARIFEKFGRVARRRQARNRPRAVHLPLDRRGARRHARRRVEPGTRLDVHALAAVSDASVPAYR